MGGFLFKQEAGNLNVSLVDLDLGELFPLFEQGLQLGVQLIGRVQSGLYVLDELLPDLFSDRLLLGLDEAFQHDRDGEVDVLVFDVVGKTHPGMGLGHPDDRFDVPWGDVQPSPIMNEGINDEIKVRGVTMSSKMLSSGRCRT